MPAPATIDAFLEVLGKSGLVEAERLRLFVRQADDLPTAPRPLAARLVAAGLVTRFQAEQLLQGKHRGYTLGKYKVLERIGAGGHSTVYLGEHLVVRRRVAIKVLPTDRSTNPTALTRFYREARAAGALDHPNLVRAHDIDQENGLHFFVMDYVDGSSLQAIVSRFGPLSVARAAHYIRQAAGGLQAAHLAGLVHRDVKPANILLDRRGVVRVTDLGLARFFSDEGDPLTIKLDNNAVLGTADYVAPEQALNSHSVDIRADIYSLGGTFYFLLTGQPLFPGGKIGQKLIWHQTRQPRPIRELRPEVPEDLAVLIERMIQKEPVRRYQTPAEVIEALAPWTVEPLPPPTEAEMPRLSPALRTAACVEAGSRSSLSLGSASSGSSLRSLVSGSRPEILPPDMATSAAVSPRPPTALPTPPLPAAQTDTAPAGVAPGEQPAALHPSALLAAPVPEAVRPATTSRSTVRPRLLAAVLLVPVAVLTGTGVRWLRNTLGPKGETPAAIAETLIVSRSRGDFPSIAAALRAAPADTRILLRESTWEEALQLDGARPTARNIRIEGRSPTGASVVWRSPRAHPAEQPLVRISGRTDVTLTGFTLDGEDRIDNLISLAGPCAELVLEDLHLRGFRQNGIVLYPRTESRARFVSLQRFHINLAASGAAPAQP